MSEFLILQKSIVFDSTGTSLGDQWFIKNRDRLEESDPAKIPILMPKEWISDAISLRRYFDRVRRRKEISNSRLNQARPPSLGLIRNYPNNSQISTFSNPGSFLPETQPENSNNRYEMLASFNDPQNQGNLSLDNKLPPT